MKERPMSMSVRWSRPALLFALVLATCPSAPAQQARPLGEADLIKLVELQVGDEAVVARVEKSGVAFPVGTEVLERLRRAGVSDVVLAAVRRAGRPAEAITYQGILQLLKQNQREDQILKQLEDSPTTFTLDRNQVAELERAGASPRLLKALTAPPNSDSPGSDISDFVVVLDCSGSMKELTPDGT